jgi:hypothetical protein
MMHNIMSPIEKTMAMTMKAMDPDMIVLFPCHHEKFFFGLESKIMRRNLDPHIWGASYWTMLHAAAEAAPEPMTPEARQAYEQLFDSLPHILPCEKCRYNLLVKYENGLRPPTHSRDALMDGVFRLHNAVNRALGKPEATDRDAYKIKTKEPETPKASDMEAMHMAMVFLLLLIVCLFLTRRP